MNKTLAFIALGLLLILNIQETTQQTCADQPILKFLESFLPKFDGYFAGRPKGEKRGPGDVAQRKLAEAAAASADDGKKASLDTAIAAFKQKTAAVVSDLTVCKDYNTKTSCCTADFENKVIKKVIKAYFHKSFLRQPKINKLLRAIIKLFQKCMEKDQLAELKDNKDLKAVKDEFRKCHKEGIISQLNLVRGTVCSLCVDPAQINTVFVVDNADQTKTKLKIKADNFKAYDDAMQASIKCYEAAADKFKTWIEAIKISDKCSAHLEKIKKHVTEGKHKNVDKKCKENATLLGDGCSGDLADDGKEESGLEAAARRMLVEGGGFSEDAAGINAYVVDAAENSALTAEGDTLDLSDAKAEQDAIDAEKKDASSSSALSFTILAVIALVSLMI